MDEPLSPDRIFNFPEDELEPHPAYDFFAPALLPGYASNLNHNNGWLAADDYLLGELEAMVGEQMVVPASEEVAEPVAKAEEEWAIALVDDIEEGQMDVPMIDMEEDLAVLFGEYDDFENDSEGVDEEEAWEVNEEWLMAPVTPPTVPVVQPPSVYKVGGPSTTVAEGPSFPHLAPRLFVTLFVIEDLSTRLGNLEYGHGQLVQRINQIGAAWSSGAGLADRHAAERQRLGRQRLMSIILPVVPEHTDAVHFGIGETNCSIGEKITRALVVLVALHFDFLY
nr:hypothetical protein [Tanacetum cinerariifolium]